MIDVIMPKMGESITDGTIIEWKKSIGDSIQKDETLLEISTDKVDSEVPSPASGRIIEILASKNDTVLVGEVIARINDSNESDLIIADNKLEKSDSEKEPVKDKSTMQSVLTKTTNKNSSKFYSPLVRSIAKKENILISELDNIKGTGNNGRVNKADILAFLDNKLKNQTHQENSPSIIHPSTIHLSNKVESMSRMRKKIAEHMVNSKRVSPHVYTTVEADVTNLVKIRKNNKDNFKEKFGFSLTYTPMLLDACIRSIHRFPLINASLDGDNIIYHQNINMGIAVALPDDNLIVPVIHSAEEKNFLGLARSTFDLANRARENNLKPDEVVDSTFTLTNPGVFGGLFGMGIINQPNVGIIAVGSFQKRPVVKETDFGDAIVVRHMVYLTMSYDHRIIDGAYGTKFLSFLVESIEKYDETRINN